MEQYISMGFNILLLVFILSGFLAGVFRGLRKTAARGIFLVIIAVITLFITIPITNMLLGIKFDTSLELGGETITGFMTIEEILAVFIKNLIGENFIESNPEAIKIIIALPLMLINVLVYFVLFWILKYALFPINYLFYRLTFAPRKRKSAFGFSAFNNDPNDLNSIYNINSNRDATNDSGVTPLPTGNPFDLQTDNSESQPVEMLDNTTIATPEEAEENKIVDNSIFHPTTINHDDKFIIKDPKNEEIEKTPTFDVSMSSNNMTLETPNKEKKKKKEKIKVKKYRLWGGLVGIFISLFIMSNTMLPVFGMLSILREANKIQLNNISETEISLTSATNGISNEILNAYDSSALKFIATYTGIEGLSLAEFDYLTTQKVGDNDISLRKEISTIVETTEKIDTLLGKYKEFAGTGNLSTLTQPQLKILLEDTHTLINYFKNIKFIEISTNYIIPITCNVLLQNSTNITDNDNINQMITDLITSIKDESINVFDEFNALIDVAEYLNDKNVLTKILQNDYSEPFEIINSLDSGLTDKLFELKTINVTIPHIINIALAFADQSLEFGFVKNEADATTIKNSLSDFIDKTIEFAKTIDTDSSILITNESLVPLGKTLQVIKSSGLLKQETYENFVDFAINKLQDIITDITPDSFDNYAKNELLNNISKVDNWEHEMLIINDGILKLRDIDNGILGDVVEGEDLRQGLSLHIDMKENVLINLGKAFDILEESCIFGARTYIDNHQVSGVIALMSSIFDFANTTISDEFNENTSMQNISTVIEEMNTNLVRSEHTYAKNNPFWEQEFTKVSPLIIGVYDMFNAENFDFDTTLGKNLDKAKGSTMLGGSTTLSLMNVALDIVEDQILGEDFEYNNGSDLSNPQDINDKIYELFNEIETNLNTNSTKEEIHKQSQFWENEIGYYTSLKNIADKSTTITEIDDAIELSEDLDNVYQSYTIPRQSINNIIAFAIRDTKYTDLTSDDKVKSAINDTIESIASKLEDETYLDGKDLAVFWSTEFTHIKNITNIKFNDETGYSVKDNLTNIGKELDNVCLGYAIMDDPNTSINESKTIRASYLISHANLRNILGSAIDEMSESLINDFDNRTKEIISTALTSIKTNVMDTTNIPQISFKFELGKLQKLSNLELSADLVTYPTGTDTEISAQLASNRLALISLGSSLDDIAFNYIRPTSVYEYDEDQNSKIITRQIINKLIIDMFELGNVEIAEYDEDNTKLKKNAFNDLIDSIQTEIQSHSTKDHIISWERELEFVNTLVSLNKNTNYTIDNAHEEIGKTVDALAFNIVETGTYPESSYMFNDIFYTADDLCTYFPTTNGNSLFITRSAIKTAMSGFLASVKKDTSDISDPLEKEEKDIVNAIIDNISPSVASNNTELNSGTKYPNMEFAFKELKSADTLITTLVNSVDGSNIESLITNNQELGKDIDEILDTFESAPITGVIITRRMAILILDHIEIPTTPIDLTQTDAGKYHNECHTAFTNNHTAGSTTKENYLTNKYFETLFGKSLTPSA